MLYNYGSCAVMINSVVSYVFRINPTPSDATVTLTASGYTQSGNSIQVPSGTTVSWSVSKANYITQSGTQVVTSNLTKSITLSLITYTFTVNPTPSDATVTLTASGYTQQGNSIVVANGTSVSWQVALSGYATQSGTQTITSNYTKSVTLVSVPVICTTTSTISLAAGTYKYMAVGGGGGGSAGRCGTSGTRTASGGCGGGGGGSGYITVGTFTTSGENVTITIGASGAEASAGGDTTIVGATLGTITTAEGGKASDYSAVPISPKGGNGGSGGGAGGFAGTRSSTSTYAPSSGGDGAYGGGNGGTSYVSSTGGTYSGGVGYYNIEKTYDSNKGTINTSLRYGIAGGAGHGLVNNQSTIVNNFTSITLDTLYGYISGGGGGSATGIIPSINTSSEAIYYGGPSGGGGSWTNGTSGVAGQTTAGTPGVGGSGAVIYARIA